MHPTVFDATQHIHQLKHLVRHQLVHHRTFARHNFNQMPALQNQQCLTHRSAGDLKLIGNFEFLNARPAGQVTKNDLVSQMVRNLFGNIR